ncbi:glyoxalase, partial [Clostridioides difficile]|uniref:glyoxalase n=1 Tax=Clostridioides difficile TaxID=1496 RepID=UPI000BB1D164
YKELFEQEIELDLGKNVTCKGGVAIQEDFAWLTGINRDTIIQKSNNMELYFEVDDFDEFIEKLNYYKDVGFVHKPLKHEWQQRVVRIYDPDKHIIGMGESMEVMARGYLPRDSSVEETSKLIQHPFKLVKRVEIGKDGFCLL